LLSHHHLPLRLILQMTDSHIVTCISKGKTLLTEG
jgi:hypothetical protein